MGNDNSSSTSNINERVERDIAEFKKHIAKGPDLKVNQSIVMFCSLTSTECLKRHYEKRRMETRDCAGDWTKSLVEKFSAFTSEPELAGLGALAVAVLIDTLSFSPTEETIEQALMSVFAGEKASGVWNLIDEFLKRYKMNINRIKELRNDIERIEQKLSVALTKLKNSMVMDGHVTNQAVKIWVNGAAFHIQMLIHLERLGGTPNCEPIKNLIQVYMTDLDAVFKKHEKMIKGKCRFFFISDTSSFSGMEIVCDYYLINEESLGYLIGDRSYDRYLEAYYDERYGKQKREIKKHFSDVEVNLLELVRQRVALDVRR